VALRLRVFGIALILTGIGSYALWHHWASAHKWEPLSLPVSLSPGVLQRPSFEINTTGTYRVAFASQDGFGHSPDSTEPPYYQYFLPDLGASWSLSRNGQIIARGSGQECDTIGEFKAGTGQYVLEVRLSHNGARFNSLNPRIVVFETGGLEEMAADLGFLARVGPCCAHDVRLRRDDLFGAHTQA